MNIVKESIGKLNETLTVALVPADYEEAVEKALKDMRRKARVPGFRVGHVPMGMIERQYKSSVMIDEVSKLVNEQLESYLRENQIHILFEPMAVPEKTVGDFEKGGDFSFTFEIGIRPEVKVDYAKAAQVPYLKVKATEEQINEEEEKLRRRLGKFSSTETIVDGDMALVTVTAEGKEPLSSSLPTSYFKESHRAKFVGKKLHDTMTLDTKEMLVSDYERATLLKCKPIELEEAPVKVKISVDAIHHIDPAELNEEFYSRAFPDEGIKDEAGMRARLKSQIERTYESQERMQYRGMAMEALMAGVDIELPDAFVKKYLMDKDAANYTADNIEERYPDLQKSLCFQLMENTIAADGNVNVTRDDVLHYLQDYMAFNYFGQEYQQLSEAQRKSMASVMDSMLQQEKTVTNVYDNLYFERVTDVIREKAKAKVKEVSWDEFLNSANRAAEAPKAAKKPKAKKAAAPKEGEETAEAKPKKSAPKKTAAKKEAKEGGKA
ncbi:MAG: hypothetical protein J5873_05270 [Bacteroidales bacterium]|nr:hypothetical protein [Bacteroidales bacterium]